MSLPNLNETKSFSQIELPSGKKIGITPWKVKEERELLFAIEGTPDPKDKRKEIIKMIKQCVDSEFMFNKLSNTDYVYLLAQLRKNSKGNKIEYNTKCKCGFELIDDVIIDRDLKVKKFISETVTVNDQIKLTTKEVSFEDFDKLGAKYTKHSEYNYQFILHSIDTLIVKDEVFEEFSIAELGEFLDRLTSNEFGIISNAVDSAVAEITMEKNVKCGRCKAENKVNFGDLYSFLAF